MSGKLFRDPKGSVKWLLLGAEWQEMSRELPQGCCKTEMHLLQSVSKAGCTRMGNNSYLPWEGVSSQECLVSGPRSEKLCRSIPGGDKEKLGLETVSPNESCFS